MSKRPRRRRRPIPRKPAAKPKAVRPPAVPPAAVPPADAPPTAVPPTAVPPTAVPPAAVPPAAVPPAAVPAAAVPPAVVPASAAASASDTGTAVKEPPKKAAAAPDPYVGRTIGRCKIEERIGRGKTAFVYRAHYEALDEKVAIKILTPHAASMPELVERFITEARVVAKLDNENVVKVYDVGSDGADHYMVMELLDGFSVLDLIQREDQVSPIDALRVIRQAANGIAAAHDKGIIHRDIKPQNLLLLEDGTVKVLDFGLAAGYEDKNERVGTPHYMAPEVCRDGTADLGTDVYALGIVLWHLLAGSPPYAGMDIKGILRKHIAAEPLRIERKRTDVPKDVAELVRTLTKSDPLLRPPASEIVELLDRIGGEEIKEHSDLRKRASRARRARAQARAKSPLGPALAGIVLVAGIGIAIAMGSGGGDEEPEGAGTSTAGTSGVGTKPDGPPADVTERRETDLSGVKTRETEAQRDARIRREQEEAEREAADKAAREAIGNATKALGNARQWARENWHGKTDTEAVRNKYMRVYRQFKKTPAGKEARTIARGIKEGTVHPHPDRSWSDAQSIAQVREAWRQVQPKIDALIGKHQYVAGYGLLPDRVNEADGALTADLRFWDKLISQLKVFKSALVKEAPKIAKDDRSIETPDGEGQVRIVTPTTIEVTVAGGLKKYQWTEIDGVQILDLARRAFAGKGTRYDAYTLAFAWAHRLEDAFWDVQLDVMSAPDKISHEEWVGQLEKRFAERVRK